nr:F-box/FBD/LRR-repeat protein At1g13570-like [Ipomoea batatas]
MMPPCWVGLWVNCGPLAERFEHKSVANLSQLNELPLAAFLCFTVPITGSSQSKSVFIVRFKLNKHGRLAFDWEFLLTVQQCQDDYGKTLVNIINNILFARSWPVKKFTLHISYEDPQPQQSDIDRWCLFLSRNGVEELNICLDSNDDPQPQLPFCLLSCRTFKELIVRGPTIDLPVNACGIFSNVTSLAFFHVRFKCSVSGIASSISFPKLEKLAFGGCRGINKFEIGQPKLEMLSVIGSMYEVVDSRWLAPHLKVIKTLWLSGSSLWVRI